MESNELSKYENWMCVEDPFLQIRSHFVLVSTLNLMPCNAVWEKEDIFFLLSLQLLHTLVFISHSESLAVYLFFEYICM